MDGTIAVALKGVVPIHADADADATFELLLEDRYADLLRLAVLLARDFAEAQDALQTALERAWRARRQVQDPSRLEPWLRRILVREVIRRQTSPWARLTRPATPLDLSAELAPSSDPDLGLDVVRAIAGLPIAQRAVVVLHHYAGYQVDEIAEIVRAPAETVRSRLRLAMVRIRAEVAK